LQVDTENPPFNNDTTTYAYDALGRVSSLTIPSAGAETFTYDPVGRLKTHGTALGTFNYSYLGNSSQVTNRTVTNGATTLTTTTGYDTNANDRRLKSIAHSGVGRSYSPANRIRLRRLWTLQVSAIRSVAYPRVFRMMHQTD
jgi:uncharacterized protein RhaS with RHS repeats